VSRPVGSTPLPSTGPRATLVPASRDGTGDELVVDRVNPEGGRARVGDRVDSTGVGMSSSEGSRAAPGEALPATGVSLDFDDFYRRELASLVGFARALSGSAYADDLAQEAMLSAYTHWDRVSRMDLPIAWVRRVCANRAVSAHRRRLVEAKALLRIGGRREPVAHLDEDHEQFWTEVRRLPKRQAQAVALFYVYDLSVHEIAQTLEVSEGSVKVHLSRGRAALAQRLGESEATS
jgi:RNA polymerase sigma factor (sigma-70 family)